jgi:hypothetical protein
MGTLSDERRASQKNIRKWTNDCFSPSKLQDVVVLKYRRS